jgi:hypothetical protein
VAELKLLTATAGAGLITADASVNPLLLLIFFGIQLQLHDLGRGPVGSQQIGHDIHRPADVIEEGFVAGAEVI